MGVQGGDGQYRVAIHTSVNDIAAARWNALVTASDIPFLEWEWFAALERSGSISVENGWEGAHVVVTKWERIVAIAPLYVKMNSWGELAFDYAWQRVAQQIGADYFPKLVGMVPATPCTGYRFLIADGYDRAFLTAIIIRGVEALITRWNIKTVAFNFADDRWAEDMCNVGYHIWSHHGFSWRNDAFPTFAAYCQQFTKNQRRNIRRECAALQTAGLAVELLLGTMVPRRYFDIMYDYYLSTNERFGPFAARFLNRAFFDRAAEFYAHRILFSCCFEHGQLALPYDRRTPVAMAMIIHKNDMLYGRYWGCRQHIDMVHFNVCYYAPIAWAIARGYRCFDPGIGGEHKLRRGFVADKRHTLLRFADPRMQTILEQNQRQLNQSATQYAALLNEKRPLKTE